MEKRSSVILGAAALALFAVTAAGAVKVVTFSFGAATADYTVPAGKVLLIEHVSAFYGNSSGGSFDKVVLSIASATENNPTALTTTQWAFSTSNPNQIINLDRPLRVGPGSTLNIFDTLLGAAKQVEIQGLLVDQADLYAANLGIDVKAVSIANQRLTERVKVAGSRPSLLRSTTSPDLQSWVENLTQIVTPQPDHVFDVSTGIALDTHKFLRVSARAPEIQ